MRLLISIQCCFPESNNTGLVFLLAWKNFLDKHSKDLDCDFVFVNNGLSHREFEQHCGDYKSIQVPSHPGRAVWDTDSSFHPFITFHNQYDFILRVDSDAFLTIENINNTIEFLKNNPETDFVSATNFCRPITNSADSREMVLDSTGIPLDEIPNCKWIPWYYPTHNSDLYIIRSEFFRKCIQAYNSCQYTRAPGFPNTPFDTANMTYAQVCHILNHQENRFPAHCLNWKLRIDGSINIDFWTILCSLKPNMVGILNYDNRSFRIKNHLLNYGPVLATGLKFDDLTDSINIAYPHQQNIIAPYFHMGNAYVSDSFFDVNSHHLKQPNTIGQFQSAAATFVLAHYAMVLLLTKSSGHQGLLNKLNISMNEYFQRYQIDKDKVLEHYNNILKIYKSPIEPYLNEDNIVKYK